ncbi:hypothetical protein AgCh_022892 [Apium graveolens]
MGACATKPKDDATHAPAPLPEKDEVVKNDLVVAATVVETKEVFDVDAAEKTRSLSNLLKEMFEVAGERNKKRYDHKVDVYSFSLVLWELLTNTTPFKGKCYMTTTYAVVTQNMRPSTDNITKEIVSLLVSCWAEDPIDRPKFIEIKCFIENFIHYLWTPDTSPPRMIKIEHANELSVVGECEFTSHGMQNPNAVSAITVVK